jgi:hypothetical protein
MWKIVYISFALIFTTSVFPGEHANRLCWCLKESLQSNDKEKKKKCKEMEENIITRIKEGSAVYKEFKEEMAVCERNLVSASYESSRIKSLEEKVEEVCRCYYKSYGNKNERMKCSHLKEEYINHYTEGSEQRKNFTDQTNICF